MRTVPTPWQQQFPTGVLPNRAAGAVAVNPQPAPPVPVQTNGSSNVDGGQADTNYGGIHTIDGGEPDGS
jgi:hypothetical protein